MHTLALRAAGPCGLFGSRAAECGGRRSLDLRLSEDPRQHDRRGHRRDSAQHHRRKRYSGLPSHRGEGTRPASVRPGAPLAVADQSELELREVLAKTLDARVDVGGAAEIRNTLADRGDPVVWSALVEFGLPGLSLDESRGGAGAPARSALCRARGSGQGAGTNSVGTQRDRSRYGRRGRRRRRSPNGSAGERPPRSRFRCDDGGWVTTGASLPVWDGRYAMRGSFPS